MSSPEKHVRDAKFKKKREGLRTQVLAMLDSIEDMLSDTHLPPHDVRFLSSLRISLQSLARIFTPLPGEPKNGG